MRNAYGSVFADLPVLVTGHTGFKGSWLTIWLRELGARVIGFSLDPPTSPNNFSAAHLAERVTDLRGDVRDLQALREAIEQHQPQVAFHLAAQPIVLRAYREPKETFDINVTGTVNVLEAVRCSPSVKAMVCITTDKVYEDREWIWGYREADALGGRDPYSASKAMAEVAIASYRQSYFSPDASQQRAAALASARAGNVIGGGDWAPYRLVPDCMRALMAGEPILLRNPRAIRPWLHVLEALSGYLWLAAKLLQGNGESFAEAWNFGPSESQGINGEKVVQKAIQLWGSGSYRIVSTEAQAESQIWRLNWDKAANRLSWRPLFTWEEALRATVDWFKSYQTQQSASESIDMYAVCVDQIAAYSARARECAVGWAM